MMVQFGDTIYLKAETKREEDEEGFILYVYNINTRTCRPYNSNKQNITFPRKYILIANLNYNII